MYELEKFLKENDNWEAILTGDPYYLKVKRDGNYVIFNYDQLKSDFSNILVQQARGIIFREDLLEPVCVPFFKFFNYGEPNCAKLDWSSVKVSEKIDGSIMKLWFCDGEWHVSTNGAINAKDAPVPDIRKDNFYQLFKEGVINNLTTKTFAEWLDSISRDYTYIFEMVSPYTRVVIPYEKTNVYFLGANDNITGRQFGCSQAAAQLLGCGDFPVPKQYSLNTLDKVTAAANALPWYEEGYVCYDKNFNRCKIKSPRYVCAHFARNNNVITRKHLIDIILKGEMNEFLIYAADYADQMKWTKQIMDEFTEVVDTAGMLARNLRKLTRPEAAEVIKHFHKLVQPIMFANHARHVSGREYVRDWDVYKWERNIENFLKMINGGKK